MAASTATPGADFVSLPTSVTIPAGAASATVTLTAITDTAAELQEAVTLRIVPDGTYGLNGAIAGAVAIKDDEAPVVDILAIDPRATEGGDTGKFRIQRRGNPAPSLTVPVIWTGTAVNGTDYNVLAASFTLGANASSLDVTVTVKQDTVVEAAETVIGTIQTSGSYTVGDGSASVRIGDDESGGVVAIRVPVASGYEYDAQPAYIEVYRTGRVTTAVTVPFSLFGTATVHEFITPRQVVIPAGMDQVRLIVTPLRDQRVENDESVILRLLTGSGYILGSSFEGTFLITESPSDPG
jgi:hypothetical protein